MQSHKSDYFDSNPNSEQFTKSLQVWKGVGSKPQPVSPAQIIIADLGDWNYQPKQDHIAVDLKLGRMIFLYANYQKTVFGFLIVTVSVLILVVANMTKLC
ncbi:hypothetical protein [uncultured Nostoc sp.]|uniref:hypothetical protein n=1 Tax=uncultured Nostoc sp. TaxID=340711 RepID=UPI0035CAF9A2